MDAVPPSRIRSAGLLVIICLLIGCDAELKHVERTPVPDLVMEVQPLNSLVTNGDAELGVAPWLSVGALLKPVVTEAYNGEWSLMLWQRRSARDAVVMPLGPLPAAQRYKATVYVKLPGNAERSVMTLEWRRAVNNSEIIKPLASITPNPGEWTALTGTFEHIDSEDYGGSALAITAENPAATFFVDALDVVEAGPVDASGNDSAAQPQKRNFALNGGAETGYEFWIPQSAKLERVTEPVRSGEYSMFVSNRTNDWNGPSMRFEKLQAGRSYRFTAYVQAAADSSPVVAQITIKTRIDGIDEYFPLSKETVHEGKWQRLSGIYQHKSSTGLEEIYAYIEANPPAAEFFVDDFQVEELH